MKILLFILFTIFSYYTWALENIGMRGNIISIVYGMHTIGDNTIEADLGNIEIEHKKTGIGIEYNITKIWGWIPKENNNDSDETFRISLLNLGIYWNIFSLNFGNSNEYKLYFGPFNKISYIFSNNEGVFFEWNEFVYSAGLRVGISFYNYNFLKVELGYRNTNGNNDFHARISADVFICGIFIYST